MLRARKRWRCSKCGREIPVGTKYYAMKYNYHPVVRRCSKCNFAGWENTTSDYLRAIGRLKAMYQNSSVLAAPELEETIRLLEDIYDELEQSYWNLPENLTYSSTSYKIEDRKNCVESVIEQLRAANTDCNFKDIREIINHLS